MSAEIARAKINLTLHVGSVIEASHRLSGYHPVNSLIVFADIGDTLSCEAANDLSLTISGPFSTGLETDHNNLILKAWQAVAKTTDIPPLAFHLTKNLPVAAGIGGGSANAAATLRLLQNYTNLPREHWHNIATGLGADVPVCLHSKTSIVKGIGQVLTPIPGHGRLPAILVNPGISVSTRDVFTAFDTEPHAVIPKVQSGTPLLNMFLSGLNDLQPYTIATHPQVQECLDALRNHADIHPKYARMSGSGATCFAICDTIDIAKKAAADLSNAHPDWWSVATFLGEDDR